jgi:hypothetical protein
MTDLSRIPDEALSIPHLQPGVYRHYKGTNYEVIAVSLDTETLQPYVVYRTMNSTKPIYWTRPYDMFVETVTVDGKEIPRFELQTRS